jgi:hypothetical protein
MKNNPEYKLKQMTVDQNNKLAHHFLRDCLKFFYPCSQGRWVTKYSFRAAKLQTNHSMRRARLPDFISVLPFQKICFQSFSRTLSTQSNLPCLPFTSVIVYCHPPLLELEHLKTKDAIEDHQARLETHVPDLLAKFCTPKSNGNFQGY